MRNLKNRIIIVTVGIMLFFVGFQYYIKLNPDTARSIKDKEQISISLLNNIEMNRRLLSFNINGFWINGKAYEAVPDSMAIYHSMGISASYWDDEKGAYFAFKRPIFEYMQADVVTLKYSRDSLKCVALVVFEDRSNSTFGTGNKRISFKGRAYFGLRNDINSNFKLYPMDYTILTDNPFKIFTVWELRSAYNNLKGGIPPYGTNTPYQCGINNPNFFETAPELEFVKVEKKNKRANCDTIRVDSGEIEYMYAIQTDFIRQKRFALKFYCNQDSTVYKDLRNTKWSLDTPCSVK